MDKKHNLAVIYEKLSEITEDKIDKEKDDQLSNGTIQLITLCKELYITLHSIP